MEDQPTTKKKGTIIRPVAWQRGLSIDAIDARRTALPPGWRLSKNGKFYHEARRNRTDFNSKI